MRSPPAARRAAVLLVFLLSGAAGLVYQVAWTRRLVLILGSTSQAVSAVLAVFMGGLALGAWRLGRAGDRARSPLRLYGLIEVAIALLGLASPWILDALRSVYVALLRASPLPGPLLPAARLLLACAALLAPTTLMGATLPALARAVSRGPGRLARDAGLLYAANTAGAVLGALLTAYVLVRALGLRATIFAAAGMNLVAGLGALALAGRRRGAAPEDERGPDSTSTVEGAATEHAATPTRRDAARAVLLAFGASGFLALAYEVLWTRYLIYVLGESSVYAFSSMLAAFLLGIALGSLLAAWLADRAPDLEVALGVVIALVGAAAVGTVAVMGWLSHGRRIRPDGLWGVALRDLLRCLAVLLVPATLSGSTFALVARLCAREPARLGADIGRAYAANTLGAILGALAGGFLVLPLLGLRAGLCVLGAASLLVGLGLLLRRRPAGPARRAALATTAIALAAAAAAARADDPGKAALVHGDEVLVFHADGPESSVAVVEARGSGHRTLIVDGDRQAGTSPRMQIHLRLLGHLPALLHPDPRAGLVVGLGAGVTAGALAQQPLERVEVVELSAEVIDAAPFFAPFNHDPLRDAKVRLIRGDGRNHLLSTRATYDIITTDPVDPDDAGATSLYAREYYELVRAHLRPGGVACQWIPDGFDPEASRMLLRTFQAVFPYTSIWFADVTNVVVGSVTPPRVTLGDVRRRLSDPRVRASLGAIGAGAAEEVLALFVAGPEELRALAGEGPLNTDDRPRIEYAGPRRKAGASVSRGFRRPLFEARGPGLSGLLARFGPEDEAVIAPLQGFMRRLYARDLLELQMAEDAAGAGGAADRPLGARLERLRREEEMDRRALDLGWDLLAADVPRLMQTLAGLEPLPPPPDTPPARARAREEALARARAAWAARDWARARAELLRAAAAVPGTLRPELLAAACLDRQGRPLDAAEEALRLDFTRLDAWSDARGVAARLVAQAFGSMDRDPGGARALGQRVAALLPPEDARPPARRGFRPWARDEPAAPRPTGEALGDPDAWRRWWAEARLALEPRAGRFGWIQGGR